MYLARDPLCNLIQSMATQNYNNTSKDTVAKIYSFLNELNSTSIDEFQLSYLAFRGVPEECRGLRTVVWKILLGTYPLDCTKFQSASENNNKLFNELKVQISNEEKNFQVDHPLSKNKNSVFTKQSNDKALWELIEKDIKRTQNDTQFFIGPIDSSKTKYIEQIIKQSELLKADLSESEKKNYIRTHGDAITELLFIYAKLNKTIYYVQGMNELIGVIYYCFYKDLLVSGEQYFQSDVYFTFMNLMSETKRNFIGILDMKDTGEKTILQRLEIMCKTVEKDLYNKLMEEGMKFEFFSIRWLLTMFSQDFLMPEVERLWDSILSDKGKYTFFLYLCVSILHLLKDTIMQSDFNDLMKIIKDGLPKETNADDLIKTAKTIILEYGDLLSIEAPKPPPKVESKVEFVKFVAPKKEKVDLQNFDEEEDIFDRRVSVANAKSTSFELKEI